MLSVKGLGLNKQNTVLLAINGATATVSFAGSSVSYTFSAPLNTGALGLGSNNALVTFTGLAKTDELELLYLHLQSMRNFEGLRDRLDRSPDGQKTEEPTEPEAVA